MLGSKFSYDFFTFVRGTFWRSKRLEELMTVAEMNEILSLTIQPDYSAFIEENNMLGRIYKLINIQNWRRMDIFILKLIRDLRISN